MPTGTNCIMIGFIDQNNTGIIGGPGEISNATTGIGAAQFNLTGAMPNENLTLPNGNSVATLRTYDMEQINLGGVTTYSYAIDFRVNGLYKLPVSVELFSETPEKAGAAADVVLPSDIATDALNAGSGEHSNAGSTSSTSRSHPPEPRSPAIPTPSKSPTAMPPRDPERLDQRRPGYLSLRFVARRDRHHHNA